MMTTVHLSSFSAILRIVFGGRLTIEYCNSTELELGGKIISIYLEFIKPQDNNQDDYRAVTLKMLPVVKCFRETYFLEALFKNEIFMYGTILPAYKRFEIDSGISESEVLNIASVHYGSQLIPNPAIDLHGHDGRYIVLENLQFEGYYKDDRKIGANLIHSKLGVQALAKFHSTGIAMKHNNPEEFEILKNESTPVEVRNPQEWIEVVNNIFRMIASDSTIKQYIDSCVKLYELEKDHRTSTPLEPWTSIIHGDFTILNIVFCQSPDESIPEDVKFVDFLNHAFASPLHELALFLATSTDQEVFENHYDELLDLYYETLKNRLTLFGVDAEFYSKESFDNQYRQDARLHFSHYLTALQIITFDLEFNEIAGNLTGFLKYSQNERFCEKLRNIITLYDRRGWFD
ncbi:uncharacterized protein LOC130673512 [Microplitis mediator]|uniref:uncharacterized protein LOC130673512 n=1 Tax=Microplitis mediator TaxID=375433 RepID=UPI0025575792|nr:uncharacterized protein LOC130673512 [Microplitis mediator]